MTAGEVANDCIERPVHPIDVLIRDTGPKLDLYPMQDCGRTWTAVLTSSFHEKFHNN